MASTIPSRDERVAMPTEQELREAATALEDAIEPFAHLRWTLHRLGDWNYEGRRGEQDEVPTLEQIGLLYSYSDSYAGSLTEIAGYIEQISSYLRDLDLVRLNAGRA